MSLKKNNRILIISVSVFLLFFFGWNLVKPSKVYSVSERRNLKQMPAMSFYTILDGSFMGQLEEYTLDQFPLRDGFRSIKVWFSRFVLGQQDSQGIYEKDGYLSKLEYPYSEESVLHAADVFEKIYHRYLTDSQVYLSVIPDKNYYLASDSFYPTMEYEELLTTIDDHTPDLEYIDIFSLLQLEDYYRTDTHWRQEKIEDVAMQLAERMLQGDSSLVEAGEERINQLMPMTLEDPFYGVYAGQYGLPVEGETLTYRKADWIDQCIGYSYEDNRETAVYDMAAAKGNDPYELFLSGPKSLLTYENPDAATNKQLILFRDSFGSAIAPYLLAYYQRVTLIDIRYISAEYLGNYVDFENADVLFLYSTLVLNHSVTLKGIVNTSVSNVQENSAPEMADQFVDGEATWRVDNPRVNFVENPVGIDELPLWFSWETNFEQGAYEIELWKADEPDCIVWKSGEIISTDTINIAYDGASLENCTAYEYVVKAYGQSGEVATSKKQGFVTSFLKQEPFEAAQFICLPDGVKGNGDGQACFYKQFYSYNKPIKRAWFYGSSLGVYDVWVNGQHIGEDMWKPGWTEYRKTLLYNTYDITSVINPKAVNNVTVLVNDGWWNGDNAFGTYGKHKPAFIGRIRMEYADGTIKECYTDESWNYETDVNIRYADFFQGETCDYREQTAKELSEALCTIAETNNTILNTKTETRKVSLSTIFKGQYNSAWMKNVKALSLGAGEAISGYVYEGVLENGSTYGAVHIVEKNPVFSSKDEAEKLLALDGEKASQVEETASVDGDRQEVVLKPGQTLLVNLGQNIAGIPEIIYRATPGTELAIQFAEMLNDKGEKSAGNDGPQGSLYRANYRAAKTQVKVIAGSEQWERYETTFFFTGFQYMTLEVSEPTTIAYFGAKSIGNVSNNTGNLVTNHEQVNQLFRNVWWSQHNNYTLIATDCPQRDERLGWTGDLQSFARTSLYNMDLYSFYRKWEQDLMDSQQLNGAFTDTAPTTINTGAGNAGWAEAGILVPWNVYCMYGNTEQLEVLYEPMTRYMDFLDKRSNYGPGGSIGGALAYGDWLSKEITDKEFLAALWYAEDALVMHKIAGVLGKAADAEDYQLLYDKIRHYIVDTYVRNPERLTQTEMCFLLRYGILEEENLMKQVEEALVQSVEKHEYLLMTGFAGTPILLQTLTDIGRSDLAYRILLCEGNPSWLYSVNQGATTIWERYDSYTVEKGFATAAMNSFDHFNEGSVAQWMYESMLGLKVDLSEETPITIQPQIPPTDIDIHEASGYYDSVYGRIQVAWKIVNQEFEIEIHVPNNGKAKIDLPIKGFDKISVGAGVYNYKGELAP